MVKIFSEIMKYTILILALGALATAQKPHKQGKGKYAGGPHAAAQYAPPQQSYQGGGGGSPGNYNSPQVNKQLYPLLLSDSRTLNTDGSINFNYAADNGLQQGETVDADGTRRGFYSYPGADGKPITVKYTAGKNGFVAEGDHLPRQPQSAAHSDKDEIYTPRQQGSPRAGHGGGGFIGGQGGHGGHGGHGGQGGGGGGGGHYSAPSAPSYPPQGPQGPRPSYDFQQNVPLGNAYSDRAPSQTHLGGGSSYSSLHGFGAGNPSAFSGFAGAGAAQSPQYAQPQPQYNHYSGGGAPKAPAYNQAPSYNPPSFIGHGAAGNAAMHNALNPYIQQGPAGPYNGNFDLGNGGHFSINFTPGAGQQFDPAQGFPGSGPSGGGQQGARQY